jgi:hypothetical protein
MSSSAAADKARTAAVEGGRVALHRATTANIPQMVASTIDLIIRGAFVSMTVLPQDGMTRSQPLSTLLTHHVRLYLAQPSGHTLL